MSELPTVCATCIYIDEPPSTLCFWWQEDMDDPSWNNCEKYTRLLETGEIDGEDPKVVSAGKE